MRRAADWFADTGARWGLPPDACAVHAGLYLSERPLDAGALAAMLGRSADEVAAGLDWLAQRGLAQHGLRGWSAFDDPWELLLRSLEARARRELPEAASALAEARRAAAAEGARHAARQLVRLETVVGDLAGLLRASAGRRGAVLRRAASAGLRLAHVMMGSAR